MTPSPFPAPRERAGVRVRAITLTPTLSREAGEGVAPRDPMNILMLHGINHDLFGQRDPAQYGTVTLAEIAKARK